MELNPVPQLLFAPPSELPPQVAPARTIPISGKHSPVPPTTGLLQDQIVNVARRRLARLRSMLLDELAESFGRDTIRSQAIRREMWGVYSQAISAGVVSGMLTPWAPHLNSDVPSRFRPKALPVPPKRMALWDTVENAMDWLGEQVQNFPDKIMGLVNRSQAQAAAYGAEVDSRMMATINEQLRESIRLGEGRADWRKRLGDIMQTRAGFDETISRTATHKAYISGHREILAQPVIADLFPYRRYFATLDNRVRPEHAAMDRKVYHKDSPMAWHATDLLNDWNCRCSETAITEDEALHIGVSPGGEPPALSAMAEQGELVAA